ncbi:roadblock/LC7 domain-containing protein [Streptomyces cinnabarinus]|uniref:Roadblock/LC7 domain-containing protein n=1 Tax=Streptomyces cinnabarinus TaxID=67287 RepID=A0ABY7KCE5_9ACTN|nr:roadblock/LC7 domain-containing protein [Streptomyces cinnabarinus]WAZ22201.1 roadblock/LC7 domain-containing protein [Streptomyces cinnabarinus]
MAAEAPILDELHRLRARIPQLTGSLAASVDGLVVAEDAPDVEPEGVAALTAAALGVAVRLSDVTGRGELRELLVRGRDGYVATYAAGHAAVLTLLAQDDVSVGRLHLEGRRAAARIGELVDETADETKSRAPARTPATRAKAPRRTASAQPRATEPRATEPRATQSRSAQPRSTEPRTTPPRSTQPRTSTES